MVVQLRTCEAFKLIFVHHPDTKAGVVMWHSANVSVFIYMVKFIRFNGGRSQQIIIVV